MHSSTARRRGGCRVFTHTRVTGISLDGHRVRGVQTEWGDVEAEVVVNAGGMFAAELGGWPAPRPGGAVRARVPGHAAVRERARGEHLPTLRNPDLLVYFREEGAGIGDGRLRAPQRAVGAR